MSWRRLYGQTLRSTVTIVSWTLAKDLEDNNTVNLNNRVVICACKC
jgi:hypothetical protein